MLTYEINYFIHSVIREGKLVHLMDALIDDSPTATLLIDDLIAQFQHFLRKGNAELFDGTQLKYLTYLETFKAHLEDIPDLKNANLSATNLALLNLYEIPKKRNNLFSVCLAYFYLRNNTRLRGRTLFKVIYLYLLIIAYRNRLSEDMRLRMVEMSDKKFESVGERVSAWLRRLARRHPVLRTGMFRAGVPFAIVAPVSSAIGFAFPTDTALRADLLGASSQAGAIGKIALDSVFLGRITDGALASVGQVGMQNILIIALLAVIVQSLRTGITNLFVNSFLTKFFSFIGTILRSILRAVFYAYNYIIYRIETRLIHSSIDLAISSGIMPGGVVFALFLLLYLGVYLAIVGVYAAVIVGIFSLSFPLWQIVSAVGAFTALLVYMNLAKDLESFRKFLTEIESTLKSIIDAQEAEKKETAKEAKKNAKVA